MIKILMKKIPFITMIPNEGERSYRITFVDFIVGVILIYFALQMYDTISTFLASNINVCIENKLVIESVASIISTLLISTKKIPSPLKSLKLSKSLQKCIIL